MNSLFVHCLATVQKYSCLYIVHQRFFSLQLLLLLRGKKIFGELSSKEVINSHYAHFSKLVFSVGDITHDLLFPSVNEISNLSTFDSFSIHTAGLSNIDGSIAQVMMQFSTWLKILVSLGVCSELFLPEK